MARPIRNNADYFSHDASMRDDPKIKAMRNKFGITGYAVYCMMLEVLTSSDFFQREVDEIEIEILSADFGIDADLFTEIIAYMVRLKLLQTVDNCTYLSQKLTDRLQAVTDKRQKARDRAVSVTESTQRKEKKKKVKETKVKIETFTPPTLEEVKAYCNELEYTLDYSQIFEYYHLADWHDANGKKIKNWKQKIRGVWCKEENKKGGQSDMFDHTVMDR